MTNQRWQVFCYRYENGDHDWVATGDKHWHRFSTWREAQDHADSKARTVEVTLPRNSTKAGRFTITTHPHPMRHITEIASTKTKQTLRVVETELEPLALALLAHHYNSKDTP